MGKIVDAVPAGLRGRMERGLEALADARRVRVISHYDADGATAAALLIKALLRRGKDIRVSLAHGLDPRAVEGLRDEGYELLLVSDIGSGQIDVLERSPVPVIILDHHQPLRETSKDTLYHCNPHLFGISGTKGACGATTTFLFTLLLDEANWDLAGIALAGCIGDRQAAGGFQGLNDSLFREALARGILRAERRLALHDLPVGEALVSATAPYFRDVSGRPAAVAELLARLGIDPNTPLREIRDGKAEALASILALRLLRQKVRPETIEQLVEDKFWVPALGLYADDLEGYINAASRLNREPLAVAMALGDPAALAQGRELRRAYVEEMLAALQALEVQGPKTMDHLQWFTATSPTLAGALCGISMQYLFDQEKPTLCLASGDGKVKVSSRGTDYLISRGLDLAVALREAAGAVGGNGGGHNIAAGATIPRGQEENFLKLVDAIVSRQLKGEPTVPPGNAA